MQEPLVFQATQIPASLSNTENATLLTGILRGIEKESLRVNSDGKIANSPHPEALGSALTHPLITTDFSEALLEFITPPSHQVDTLLKGLNATHQFTYQHIGDEYLWPSSMPCAVGQDHEIPVAQYGTSNRGRMKTAYRIGLGHRYGRTMQTVAGLHYNFSLPKTFWAFLHQQENSIEELSDFTTRRYFDLIRNFRRHYWILIYLFGASPAMCRSFVNGRPHKLEPFSEDGHTLHLPYATSLRMGDLGYQSSAQESLFVCYNTNVSYIQTLVNAIESPYPHYEKLGTHNDDGNIKQLNTSLLQIENEFYSPIRPKRTALAGETALTALCRRGVEYIEVRCLDLDPFCPIGIDRTQIHFLDTFLLFCLFQDSPDSDNDEFRRITQNQKRIVTNGRAPDQTLAWPKTGEHVPQQDWANALMAALEPVAKLLDTAHGSEVHTQALAEQRQKVQDNSLTPSAKILETLKDKNLNFASWANQLAKTYKEQFVALKSTQEDEKRFTDMAEESLRLQENEEQTNSETFEEYIERYYQQYENCCDGM